MDSERKEYIDQADKLRSEIDGSPVQKPLPSRSEVHKDKHKKSKVKIKFPLLKLLALMFILLPIVFYSIYTYLEGKTLTGSEGEKESGFVTVERNNGNADESVPVMSEKEKDDEPVKDTPDAKRDSEENAEKPEQTQPDVNTPVESKPAVTSPDENKNTSEKPAVTAPVPEKEQPAEDEYRIVYHTVKPSETIFRISMNYYKSQDGISLIQQYNNLNGNEIQVGQKLKIPLKK